MPSSEATPAVAANISRAANAGVAQGPDLRARRSRDDADAYEKERETLPVLRGDRRDPQGLQDAVVAQVRHLLSTPEIVARTWAAANTDGEASIPEREVVARISEFAPLWDELFPAEQARIVRLLVERIDVGQDHIRVQLRAEGLQTLVEQLRATDAKAAAA